MLYLDVRVEEFTLEPRGEIAKLLSKPLISIWLAWGGRNGYCHCFRFSLFWALGHKFTSELLKYGSRNLGCVVTPNDFHVLGSRL